MQIKIIVTGGVYEGKNYEGALANAPVTILIPEGIESERTLVEAQSLRRTLAEMLETNTSVTVGAVKWALRIERKFDEIK